MLNKKKLAMFVLPVLAIALVSAVVYYGFFNVDIHVNQPITVTGEPSYSVTCDADNSCVGDHSIKVSNSGDKDIPVQIVVHGDNENITTEIVGVLRLTRKDINTWQPLSSPEWIYYTLVGESFKSYGVPEGYTLIYYKDKDTSMSDAERLTVLGESGVLTEDIPHSNDWNIGDEANYCDNGYDNYLHCKGAKFWAVPDANIQNGTLIWSQPENFYFELDLAYYFANANNEIIIPAGSYIEFYPRFTVDKYASEGDYSVGIEVK